MLNESSSESDLFLRLALTDLLSEGVFCLDDDVLLCFRHCEVTDCRRAETPAMATSVGMMEAGRPRLLVSALRDCVTMTGECVSVRSRCTVGTVHSTLYRAGT